MELRDTTEKEFKTIRQHLDRIPEIHRTKVTSFTYRSQGDVKGFHLIGDKWMVDDAAEMMKWDEYFCPTDQKTTLCAGPCPDGTPHVKVED